MEGKRKEIKAKENLAEESEKSKAIKEPLAKRFLKEILLFYFIVVISVNMIHMVYQYYHTKSIILHDLKSSEKIFGKGLSEAVWNLDQNSLQAIITGMLEHPNIVGVKIDDNDKERLGAGGIFLNKKGQPVSSEGYVSVDSHERPGLVNPKKLGKSGILWRTFSIVYVSEDFSEKHAVGKATVYSTKKIIFERVKGGYWLLFINTMAVAITLCITLLLVSRKYLVKPLSTLTDAVSELILKNLDSVDPPFRSTDKNELKNIEESFNNEIGVLAKAFNQMVVDLKKYIQDLAETTAAKERVESKLEIANTIRTSMRKVIGEVLGDSKIDYSFDWIVPHMVKEEFKKGEILFHKGDRADKIYYVKKGSVKLVEIDNIIGEDEIIGETGILSPLKERTMTVVSEEDLEIYSIKKYKAIEIFYQDPSVVFELIQLSIRRSLENLKKTVAEKERIEADLRIASDIQTSVMPRDFPAFPGRKDFDIFASMEAAREVGGDFYDFFLISENKLCFLIGDVSGKGIPAALFMMITKTLLKSEALRGLSTDEILFNVNNIICLDNETCMFVTILCAILDTDTGELQIGNAGHNPPLICRDGHDFEFMKLQNTFLLGPLENIDFASHKIVLNPNDTLFFYTDGVTEAMNPEMQLFSKERIKETLSNLKDYNVTEIINGVREEIINFARGAPQSDDITMIALRFHGE